MNASLLIFYIKSLPFCPSMPNQTIFFICNSLRIYVIPKIPSSFSLWMLWVEQHLCGSLMRTHPFMAGMFLKTLNDHHSSSHRTSSPSDSSVSESLSRKHSQLIAVSSVSQFPAATISWSLCQIGFHGSNSAVLRMKHFLLHFRGFRFLLTLKTWLK